MARIRTLLVANRGEIARRITRTAGAMGIRTVAVYAEPDAGAPFVAEADEAFALGGSTAAESYLDAERLLAVAARAGADAVHPGYGFLSERAPFAEAVEAAGLTWVGPPPAAIAAMGDKLRAKDLMVRAGVPVLPSVEVDPSGAEPDLSGLTYPVLVKAAAGGGGKGMRVVDRPADLPGAIAGARREAEAAFGDGTLFVERLVTGARHVEIQVLGDRHGNLVHCFERECSIQRRHQKIIEEAPSPAVDDGLRARMGEVALAAGRAIGYWSAGTVELLLADGGEFWFLEVNTRLQVEHPVTEAVTGLDLVREQLRVAEGERLSVTQEQLRLTGHAIEARVYAEDPDRDFLPATGTVLSWSPPAAPAVRVDSGVESGTEVGTAFDPMLAKVIAHAPTRTEAALRLALALERTCIHGVTTNRDLLVAALRSEPFLTGDTTTDFLDRFGGGLRRTAGAADLELAAVAAALAGQQLARAAAPRMAGFPSGWRNSVLPPQQVTFRHADADVAVTYRRSRSGAFEVAAGGTAGLATVRALTGDVLDLELDGRRLVAPIHRHGARWWVHLPDGDVELVELPRFPEPEVATVAGGLVAPMPGSILAVHVPEGTDVVAGQVLVTLEAMKMEHSVVAPSAGTVREVLVRTGQQVANGDLLVVLEEVDT